MYQNYISNMIIDCIAYSNIYIVMEKNSMYPVVDLCRDVEDSNLHNS